LIEPTPEIAGDTFDREDAFPQEGLSIGRLFSKSTISLPKHPVDFSMAALVDLSELELWE